MGEELSHYVALMRANRADAITHTVDEQGKYEPPMPLLILLEGAKIAAQLTNAIRRLVMTDRLIFGIAADPAAGNPDQQAERLAMAIAWDEHVATEAAKRPYLLGKPKPPAGTNGHTLNGHSNGHANGHA
jgi:hypothetical protein